MMGFSETARFILDKFADVEDRINQSTFGRVFRLDGSGHVRVAIAGCLRLITLRGRGCSLLHHHIAFLMNDDSINIMYAKF